MKNEKVQIKSVVSQGHKAFDFSRFAFFIKC
jgi:hypothetical protein